MKIRNQIHFKLTYIFFVLVLFSCKSEPKVIICLSPDAYAYHSHYCMGLNRCDYETKTIKIEEAKNKGRKECGFCY